MERGNTRHTPRVDDELAHESQALVQGQDEVGHVEEWRQTEGMPDDTDAREVSDALRLDARLQDPPRTVADAPAASASPDDATAQEATSEESAYVGPDGDFATADRLAFTTETEGTPEATADKPSFDTVRQDDLGADALGSNSPGSRPISPDDTPESGDTE